MLSFWECTQCPYEGSIMALCSHLMQLWGQIGLPDSLATKDNTMYRTSAIKKYIRNFIFVYLVLSPSERFISLQWKIEYDSCLLKNDVKGIILAAFHADTWTPVSPSFICQRRLVQDNTYWFYGLLLWCFCLIVIKVNTTNGFSLGLQQNYM